MDRNCQTCAFAVISIIAECALKIDGRQVHEGGLCPDELICPFWEQGDEYDLMANGIDWSKAIKIEVD